MDEAPPPGPSDAARERGRLAALSRYEVLDTPREQEFDDIAALASEICGTPIAVVNLVADRRQWFKAEIGLGMRETPLDVSFCGHALLEEEFMLVPDATEDPRFQNNPLITGTPYLRFYAGALLRTADGHAIGTLCVLDTRPRELTEQQVRALKRLARQVMTQLELRRALRARDDVSAHFRAVLESATDYAIIAMDGAGRVTSWNKGAENTLGWTEAEAVGQTTDMIFTPEDLAAGVPALELETAAAQGRAADERFHVRKDGSRFFAQGALTPLRGGHPGFVKVLRDRTDYRQTEDTLRALNNTLEARVAERTAERDRMWRLSTDVMMVTRLDCVITAVNPAALSVLGWSGRELVGRSFIELLYPDDAASGGGLLDGRMTRRFEVRCRHKDGSYRWLSWTAVPDDRFIHAVGRDVTAERAAAASLAQAQDALRQAQKMEAVGQLTGGVAHDFNNLLTIIRSSTELLRRPGLPEDRRNRYVEAIADTVGRASKLTGQLLSFARRQALKPELFDAAERIAAITDMLRSIVGARVRIEMDASSGPHLVEADLSQFETALVNIAVNARDAMDGEGVLQVRIGEVPRLPPIRGHGAAYGPFIGIAVSDTGSGIPSGQIAQVFEPFFTTKPVGKGTGLGLSQVYGFAKQSGGDVAVDSTVGRGSTFTLYLPSAAARPAEKAAPEPSEPAPGTGDGRRVLVVEDNVNVGAFSTQMLEDLGYRPTWAANAHEALKLLDEATDAFDVVFSDVVMPGMSGLELGQEVRRRFPTLPVVLTSGYSHILAEEGRHGFELLQKPYAMEELSRILNRAIRSAPSGRG